MAQRLRSFNFPPTRTQNRIYIVDLGVRENHTSSEKYVMFLFKSQSAGSGGELIIIEATVVLKTGLVASASGSAYLELAPSLPLASTTTTHSLIPPSSNLKLTCAVHGPKPLPRSNTFVPNLQLTAHVKYAPFASRQRRGYMRDAGERDLSVHLENALRGVILADRWPKYGVDIVVTVLEDEDDQWWADFNPKEGGTALSWGRMTVLAACITAASAALVNAGIDCVDLVTGGVAAIARSNSEDGQGGSIVMDPCFSEHDGLDAACVVGYLANRDEITEIWMNGDGAIHQLGLIDSAVEVATATRSVLAEVMKENLISEAEPTPVND